MGYVIFGTVMVVNFGLTVYLLCRIGRWRREKAGSVQSRDQYSGERLSLALVSQFKEMLRYSDFQTILRIGVPLSRALWLEGQYATRVTIGRIVEEASSRLGEEQAQIQALIDDIGWTLVALGEEEEAEKYIRRGIDLAETGGFVYLAAKGYRHLSGLAIQRQRASEALNWLSTAESKARELGDEACKVEMIAGIRYGEAEAQLLAGADDVAEAKCLEARELFLKLADHPRAVKTFAQLGKIIERRGKWLEARDIYRQGLEYAKQTDRRDEIIRNLLGLARVAQSGNQWGEAEEYLARAKEMMRTTPLVFMFDSLETQVASIERRQNDGNGSD